VFLPSYLPKAGGSILFTPNHTQGNQSRVFFHPQNKKFTVSNNRHTPPASAWLFGVGRPHARCVSITIYIGLYVTSHTLLQIPPVTSQFCGAKQQNSTGSMLATSYGVVHGHNSEVRFALGDNINSSNNTYIRGTGEGSMGSKGPKIAQTTTLTIAFILWTQFVATPPPSAQPTWGTGVLLLAGLPLQRTRQVTRLVGRLVGVPLRLRSTTHPGAPMGAPWRLEREVGERLHSLPALFASPGSRCSRRGYAWRCRERLQQG
jgi:hypothetical protein